MVLHSGFLRTAGEAGMTSGGVCEVLAAQGRCQNGRGVVPLGEPDVGDEHGPQKQAPGNKGAEAPAARARARECWAGGKNKIHQLVRA